MTICDRGIPAACGPVRDQPRTNGKTKPPAPAAPCFVNAPLARLAAGLVDEFVGRRLQPEIGLNGDTLLAVGRHRMAEIARRLQGAGLGCTLHAPFSGLDPAAPEQASRLRAREALERAFACIPLFRPRIMVVHPHLVDAPPGIEERVAVSARFWAPLVALAEGVGTVVAFENTYERSPAAHLALLERLASPAARFCLDTGHLLCFAATGWQEWLATPLAGRLAHLHLHDNDGTADQHLAPGRGRFDFAGLLAFLRRRGLRATVTLEPHSRTEFEAALAAVTSDPALAGYLGLAPGGPEPAAPAAPP